MFDDLSRILAGELFYNNSPEHQAIIMSYATDASVYQERPVAVAIPRDKNDIVHLIQYARSNSLTLIPRAAGTSLAGQVVGRGIVTDISRHFIDVLELNITEKWVRVQPGVIRDDLNAMLRKHGLMFGPETSTANRAMIGGMIGNNSCGLHSIIWGDTRHNLVALKALLADGTEVEFRDLDQAQFEAKCGQQDLEGSIYRAMRDLLTNDDNRRAIETGFPRKSVHRRNSGYALDALLEMIPFENSGKFNFCRLIAGSEGTLCFITEATLLLRDLPPTCNGIVAVHTATINEALRANIIALQHGCTASELVDDVILSYTKTNIDQSRNRFFVEGDPRAILMVEFFDETVEGVNSRAAQFIEAIRAKQLGYAYPVLQGPDAGKAWELRKAGLGLLRNEPGDTQPVNLIEDCAVDASDLPAYIEDVESLLKKHHTRYSMYAHAGAGELHVEPMVNLKTKEGKELFRKILQETAVIVKKYNGSLSGEHGDGRLRGEFIPFMMGEKNYELFKSVKGIFDQTRVFNKGKIVDTPPMNEFLRYRQDQTKKAIDTIFDFEKQEGILHLAEKCSGSGDCRKTHISGGTMCPSFMATRNERDTTRARANMLRHYFTGKAYGGDVVVGEEEVKEVLDLCLSCKGCKSECPSSVDVGKMKAEFTQHYYDHHGTPRRSKLIGNFTSQMKLASIAPGIYNFLFKTDAIRRVVNRLVGFHPDRTMPLLHGTTLRKWFRRTLRTQGSKGSVYLFCDEFTNYNDLTTGQKAVALLESLGYTVLMTAHVESGRTYLSKGMVRKAKEIATRNTQLLANVVTDEMPIIGIEPSAILTLRDEYQELVPAEWKPAAKKLAKNTFLFEEWFAREIERGHIKSDSFNPLATTIYIHGHCHQKSLSSTSFIKQSLSVIEGAVVAEIPSGCCGMAGAFGYEKEHYEVSMKIGALVLFPAIEKMESKAILAASGTSCRHQIKDGTGRIGKHTAEILFDALAAPVNRDLNLN